MTDAHQAMVELHDRALAFLRDDGCRLLHVVTTASTRKVTLKVLRGLELSPFAPGPFAELTTPHDSAAPGWDVRADTLRGIYDARREGADDDEPWPQLPPPPAVGGLAGFAGQLAQVLSCTPGGRPWVVLLAPAHVRLVPHWARAIAMLLAGHELGAVRWIVVDTEYSTLDDELGNDAERTRVDARAEPIPLGLLNAPDGEGPHARSGIVGPRRPRQPPAVEPSADDLRRRELGSLVTRAAAAHEQGRPVEAVRQQRLARDLCASEGWLEQQVTMELLLGSYLLGAAAPEQAEARGVEAVALAETTETRPELLPISQLALGSTRMARGDRPGALLTYSSAIVSADERGLAPLLLEACRLAGDVALVLGMEAQAIASWGKAVAVASARPEVAALGSAGHCARAMALVCERRGLKRDAARYWEEARRLEEAGLRPPTTVEEPTPLPEESTPAPEEPKPLPDEPEPQPESLIVGEGSEPPLYARSGSTLPLEGIGSSNGEIVDETADVSVEELAVLHWNGALPSSIARSVVHQWQPEEETALRRAAAVTMTPDVTSLMTKEELAAIHGHSPLAPAREADAETTSMLEQAVAIARVKAADPEADGTAWISPEKLAEIRARLGAPTYEVPAPPPRVEPTEERAQASPPPGRPVMRDVADETTMMTREQAFELARRYAAGRAHEDDSD